MEEIEKDMTPKLIGETYMKYPTKNSNKKLKFGLYECPYCGTHWEVNSSLIKTGRTKSCGCQKINTLGITHGLKLNRFYNTWFKMVDRCNNSKNKSYKNYGARGIVVYEEWLDVRNFVAWAEATHPNITGVSLDRIDNDKGYSPENCRWADSTTQALNTRIRSTNTSGFVGVWYETNMKKWRAKITIKYNSIYIGTFKRIEEAVLARDNYIIENNLPHKLSTDYKREES